MKSSFWQRIQYLWMRLRYRRIRIFVFHHVSDVMNPLICEKEDWTQTDQFKHNISVLQKRYQFISLSEACDKLQHDKFRIRKYAVLTTDDGLASVIDILPWLEDKKIPLTLFVNTRYMKRDILKPIHAARLKKEVPDADTFAIAQKMYLSEEQIFALISPLVEIGMHGYEHINAQRVSESTFEEDFQKGYEPLCSHPRFIKAFAYPWGKHTFESAKFMSKFGVVALAVRGEKNYIWGRCLFRECIDNMKL